MIKKFIQLNTDNCIIVLEPFSSHNRNFTLIFTFKHNLFSHAKRMNVLSRRSIVPSEQLLIVMCTCSEIVLLLWLRDMAI